MSSYGGFHIRVAEWDGTSTWNFVDGDGVNGINKDTSESASNPQLTEFNSKLYATWWELNTAFRQIRVAEWDGTSTWNFVDGDGVDGINKNTLKSADSPQLTAYNSKLYATWIEESSSGVKNVRVAEWDGTSTWNFVDGNDENGINKNVDKSSYRYPQLTVFDSHLYATWVEFNIADILHIRVAEAEIE